MADSLRRAPPADSNNSLVSNDASPDLQAQLRSTAARIRKSVTEGYITPPSSRAFTKAQSTSTIFSSARDINRDLFGSPRSTPARSAVPDVNKKRSRSADRDGDAEPAIASIHNHPDDEHSSQSSDSKINRVTRPLRKHQGMRETQSMPVGAFHFSHQSFDTDSAMPPADEANEEDWSIQQSHNSNQAAFQPAVLD